MWESENQDESPLMTTDNFHGIDRLVGQKRRICEDRWTAFGLAARVTRLFSGEGLAIRRMPVAGHDPWAARTMGLAHVVALACAGALVRLEVDAFDVKGRATTSFRRLLDLVGSLLDQDAALTRAIQTQNPDAPWAAEVLAEQVEAFREDLFADDPGPLVARIGALRRALGRA